MGKSTREQSIQDMARTTIRLAVLIPTTSGFVSAPTAASVGNLVQRFQAAIYEDGHHEVRVFHRQGEILPVVRHQLIGDAIGWDATHTLFVDSDIIVPVDAPLFLIQHKQLICGTNINRADGPSAYRDGEQVLLDDSKSGAEKVDGVCMGLVLADIRVFDAIDIPYFEHKQIGDSPGFEPEFKHFWSELKQAGIPCHIDNDVSNNTQAITPWALPPTMN